jgi:hypothetical protein
MTVVVWSSVSQNDDLMKKFLPVFQLLNQLEGSGPAPAEKTKIESLPTVKISQVQVGKFDINFQIHVLNVKILQINDGKLDINISNHFPSEIFKIKNLLW